MRSSRVRSSAEEGGGNAPFFLLAHTQEVRIVVDMEKMLRANQYEVRSVPVRTARDFVAAHHYSGGMSNTGTHIHGLFLKGSDDLLGVACWLPPTRVAAETVDRENWRRVLSLSRLAVRPDVPKNGASFLMASSRRIIEREQKWVALVTYADTFMNHTGAIYRADNWDYVGMTKPQPRWEDSSGRQVAKKATKTRTKAEMEALGHKMVGSFVKHKFVRRIHMRRKPEREVFRLEPA